MINNCLSMNFHQGWSFSLGTRSVNKLCVFCHLKVNNSSFKRHCWRNNLLTPFALSSSPARASLTQHLVSSWRSAQGDSCRWLSSWSTCGQRTPWPTWAPRPSPPVHREKNLEIWKSKKRVHLVHALVLLGHHVGEQQLDSESGGAREVLKQPRLKCHL